MSHPENDPSANTAKFQAFAQRADAEYAPQRSSSSNRYIIIGAVVLAVIVVIVLIAAL
jgi:hypothetical protein